MFNKIRPYQLAVVGLIAGIAVGAFQPPANDLTFLSVGQGDCAVLRHKGHTVLIDAGPKTDFADAGERIVIPRLHQMGVLSVDLILLSHPDIDHVGGVPAILRAYPDCRIAISKCFDQDEKWLRLIREWSLKPNQLIWLPHHSKVKFEGVEMDITCPKWTPGMGDNDGSMFVHLLDEGGTAVFSGDAPSRVEHELVSTGDWRSDVLKCGHHGSKTSSSGEWVDAVHPSYAVLSVGRNNRYGHPKQEVLNLLQSKGVRTFRTDRQGDLRFVLQNGHFVLSK